MRDRIPKYPGRVRLEPVAGQENTYDLVRADEATEPGTPVNKAALLTDETEVLLFGNAADRTINDVFFGIGQKFNFLASNMATITLTVKDTDGLAVKNTEISGIFDENGSAVYTDEGGIASGYISAELPTASISGYADIADFKETFEINAGGMYTKTITVTRRNFLKITGSRQLMFSGNIASVDVTSVGGGCDGQIGSAGFYGVSGRGGYGGACVVMAGIAIEPGTKYPAVIGAGGMPGGATSFLEVSAPGGTLSSGNGAGGASVEQGKFVALNGNPGAEGTVEGYSSFTETTRYGHGGGSGAVGWGTDGGGGGTYGGDGAGSSNYRVAGAGKNGYGGGGGGGWAIGSAYSEATPETTPGGKGGSGCVAIRMHLAG